MLFPIAERKQLPFNHYAQSYRLNVNTRMTLINDKFFDLELYAIYKSIHELLGEDSWKVVWRSGEIMISELREELHLEQKTPFESMRLLGKYLEKVGYLDKIEVKQTGPDQLEYVMSNPVITRGAKRLLKEGAVPPHISTSLMFGALKSIFGMKAKMIGEPVFLNDGRAVERWKISKITE